MDSNIQILHDAALGNKVEILLELIENDPKVLEKASLSCEDKNPLHISAMFGNVEFVRQVLRLCPEMCLAGDRLGRTPLHLAVIWGRLEVVEELVQARPLAARERIAGAGGNVLHLCVKSNQLEALKCVVQNITDSDFFNRKDDDGMTILHLAVLYNKVETIKLLVERSIVQVNAKNANGRTALDLIQGPSNSEITHILQHAGAKRSQQDDNTNNPEWLSRKRDAIMVVASLIATMAFQVGVNPPGGVWQEDKQDIPEPHVAGTAVMAHKHPNYYQNFIRANTVAFVSSLSTILFLISGLPFRNRLFLWALMVIMWLTITAIATTYGIAIAIVTPKAYSKQLSHVIETAVTVWCGVMSLLLLGNTLRLINRWLKRTCGFDLWKKMGGYTGCSNDQKKSAEKQASLQIKCVS